MPTAGCIFTLPDPDPLNITHMTSPGQRDNATRLFEMNARYGSPYFQNSPLTGMASNQVSMRCRRNWT